nr:hypothetical protein [uncultured Pseudodesulfovibrio sp.]
MSILQIRHCAKCRENTYHRYLSWLSCQFTVNDQWGCVSCDGKRRKALHKITKSSRHSPTLVDSVEQLNVIYNK